jgi:hypothetical protein
MPARFAVARVDGCKSGSEVASREIEFDWRTPDAPPEFAEPQLPKRGVVLTGIATDTGAMWFHYDGFSLRTFAANEDKGLWSIAVSRQDIHEERDDVAW